MPGNVNVGGTWHTSNGASVNVGGVWHSVTQAFVNIAGTWHTWFQSKITDSFSRTTTGSLGNADTGQLWTALIGSWYSNAGVAETSSTSSGYALATVPWNANATLTAKSVGDGMGLAFWETDSGDWWAVATGNGDYSYTPCLSYGCLRSGCCGTGCNSYGCNSYQLVCNTYGCSAGAGCLGYGCSSSGCTSHGCTSYGCTSHSSKGACTGSGCTGSGCTGSGCTGYGCTGSGCLGYGCTSAVYVCNGTGCNGSGCTGSGCCSAGCTGYGSVQYVWYLNLIQSVSSAITTITNWSWTTSSSTPYINSLSVNTAGDVITVTPYSDNALTSPIATESYTASSAPTGSVGVGIIQVPGGNNPSNTIGPFTAQ